jgi:hypothetical protein|tara:strand:- start:963 stop:2270 length:1308 start_codon:yes stop_codon:yes gene_type:complete
MGFQIQVKYYNTYVLKRLAVSSIQDRNWYIEEARIRGGYNNVQTGLSPRAFLVSENNAQETLSNSIIYSGIFNSRTGINQSNQFPSGQDITRTVDPSKGSIQKLYAEDTNLTIFQERKVNRALIDKDAIYTQEGVPVQTTSNVVIGAITPYAGEFGISTNPESFAVYGYRKYFTDATQGSVLRLSQDGLTEISNYGMYDFFRDQLGSLSSGKAIGGYDIHNKCYTLSLQPASAAIASEILSFDENIKGWTSRYSYLPSNMFSIQNNFYSTTTSDEKANNPSVTIGDIYEHYSTNVNRANFYKTQYVSQVKSIFNANPSLVKTFQTINYEGAPNWSMTSFVTNEDQANSVDVFSMPLTLADMENSLLKNEFKQKEDKYFANLVNTSAFTQGEVVFGKSISGVKGFFATVLLEATNTAVSGTNELFAVSTNYKESSY